MILSTARQIQIVADTISGHDTSYIKPERLDHPWSIYLNWVREWIEYDPEHVDQKALLDDLYQDLVIRSAINQGDEAETRKDDYQSIREAIDSPIEYPPVSQVVADIPELEWLWKGWIPRGLVSLLAAVSGTGKSYLSLELSRRVICGSTFPDGSQVLKQGPVIYVDAENTPRIFKKRVSVWDADTLDHIYLMLPDKERMVINLDDTHDKEILWDMCWSIKPTLVVLDSYGSATLKGENNKEDVQMLLSYLNRLAQDFDTAVLIVHHLRKRSSQQLSFMPMTIDSIRGSTHIPAMARNVLGLQWVPTSDTLDQNGPRQLWVMKSNLGPHPEPIGVYFEPHPANPDVAIIKYGDAPQPYKEPTKTDYCSEWLEDVLRTAEEPLKPKDIVDMGKEEGYSRRTIYRARKQMHQIRDTDNQRNPENCWVWVEDEEEEE